MSEPADSGPYAPLPSSPELALRQPVGEPASRTSRFIGRLVDNLLIGGPLQITLATDKFAEIKGESVPDLDMYLILAFAWLLLAGIAQAILISSWSQSLGKMVLGMKLVQQDGSPIGFWRGVILREWAFMLLGLIPALGSLLSFFDALSIFRSTSRCLHDELAGTWVVKA